MYTNSEHFLKHLRDDIEQKTWFAKISKNLTIRYRSENNFVEPKIIA